MATLNTLRTRGGIIVTIVIALALVAFLLGDLAGRGSVFGVKEKVGEIDGKKISYIDYAERVDYMTNIQKILAGSEASNGEQQDMIRAYAWEMMINEYAVFPGYEKLGIDVSEDEMFDLIYGNNISPVMESSNIFYNYETGGYDKSYVRNFVTNLAADESGQMRAVWKYLQDRVRDQAKMSKYAHLVANMVYVTDVEASLGAQHANNYYNARYVGQRYETVPDSAVTVSNSELKKYYEDHKSNFRQVASRDIEYVIFEVFPSSQDYLNAARAVEQMAAEFEATDDVRQYVMLNSHDTFDPNYYGREQLGGDLAAYAFSANREGIYGPVLEGDMYTMARVSDIRSMPDSLGIRQLVLMPGSDQLADSLVNVLRRGGNFMAIAEEYSLMGGENADMGRISIDQLPVELIDQILESNDNYVTISNQMGIFILNTYYRGPQSPRAQVATVRYYIEPSNATQQAAYAKASGFVSGVSGSADRFNKMVADSMYSKRVARIRSTDTNISGFENSREAVRWAFNAKPGDVSGIMELDGSYLIATLASSREDGYTPLDQVSGEVAMAVRREKKADLLAQRMSGVTSLDALAGTIGASVNELDNINFNTFYLPEIGIDPAVVGAVAGGAKEGSISKPVKGLTGVYVIDIASSEIREDSSVEMERVRLEAVGQNDIDRYTFQALRELSNVKDSRAKYF